MTGVGGGTRQLHALEAHFDVAVGRCGQRVGFAPNMDRRVAVNFALQFDLRARIWARRQTQDGAIQGENADREVGLNPEVGVVGRGVLNVYGINGDRHRVVVGGRCGC